MHTQKLEVTYSNTISLTLWDPRILQSWQYSPTCFCIYGRPGPEGKKVHTVWRRYWIMLQAYFRI